MYACQSSASPTRHGQFGRGGGGPSKGRGRRVSLGAKQEEVRHRTLLPETQKLVDTFYHLASRDWRDGLCALYAYESQVPEVSASKIEGLKQFYGINDPRTLEFFTAHQQYDVEHADQVATLIDRYTESEQAVKATEEATQALWQFLDGMCRVSGIQCHSHMAA